MKMMNKTIGFFLLGLLLFPTLLMAGDEGRVYGTLGNSMPSRPVKGAKIFLRALAQGSPGGGKQYTATADDKGNFQFDDVDAGYYEVSCEHKAFTCPKSLLKLEKHESRELNLELGGDSGGSGSKIKTIKKIDLDAARVFVTY